MGPRGAVYVDVFAGGAPASYHGLILASAPEGGAGVFDMQWADEFDGQLDVMPEQALATFQERTKPNSYGVFCDEGAVGEWLHDVNVVSQLLLLGTRF